MSCCARPFSQQMRDPAPEREKDHRPNDETGRVQIGAFVLQNFVAATTVGFIQGYKFRSPKKIGRKEEA